ncbi:MAG: c-type cytochrome [Magnetococcus sp. WYHC-3]
MHHKKLRTLLVAGLLAVAGGLTAHDVSADEARAAMLANTCAGCHGTNGVAAGHAMPSIAGMPAGFTKTMMQEFKGKKEGDKWVSERPSTIMARIARGYSDEEIELIAGFFAKQKWGSAEGNPNLTVAMAVDPAQAAKGAELADKCEKCHEDKGRSTAEDMPRMAGQWLDYLMLRMESYKDPNVKMPMPKKMAQRVEKLSLDELKSLAHFYASQK